MLPHAIAATTCSQLQTLTRPLLSLFLQKQATSTACKRQLQAGFNLIPNLTPLWLIMNTGISGPFCYRKIRQRLQRRRGARYESGFVHDGVLAGHTPYQHISRSTLAKMQLLGSFTLGNKAGGKHQVLGKHICTLSKDKETPTQPGGVSALPSPIKESQKTERAI